METITGQMDDETKEEFRHILVGNIIDKHYYGENKEIKSGTKHFRPGAKVYLFPEYGGMGHEMIPVCGLPRKRRSKILVVIRANMIKNVRVKRTFDLELIKRIKANHFYSGNYGISKHDLERFAAYLNEGNVELTAE